MRSNYLIAGAIFLALVAAAAIATDLFTRYPFESGEEAFVRNAAEIRSSGGVAVTFGERDTKVWSIAGGHRLERFALDPKKGTVFARLTSGAPVNKASTNWNQGLKLTLPKELNARMSGRTIEIGFAARAPLANAAEEISVVYATQQTGNSGWKSFSLGSSFYLFTFNYKVPRAEYHAPPVITFSADMNGRGRAVEILGVYVTPVD